MILNEKYTNSKSFIIAAGAYTLKQILKNGNKKP